MLQWTLMITSADRRSSSVIIKRRYILSNFSWLFNLSVSQVVTGKVHAITNSK